jgi:hypothetical protein
MKVSCRTFVAVVALLLASWILGSLMTPRTTPPIPAPADFPPPEWDRVAIGMSRVEVVALLGVPRWMDPPRRMEGPLSLLEVIVVFVSEIWFGGLDGFFDSYGERWEYHGDPIRTPRTFFQSVTIPKAVVYFADGRVVWLRRPTGESNLGE